MEEEVGEYSPKRRRSQIGDRVLVSLASFVAIALVYLLFFDDRDYRLQQGAEPLGVIQTEGTIRRRHARSLKWRNIKGDAPLYLHDIVYVPSETTAEVTFGKGKKLYLEPNSMVQFDEVTLDAIFITLFDGEVKGNKNEVIIRREDTATPSPSVAPRKIAEAPIATPTPKPKVLIPGYPTGLSQLSVVGDTDAATRARQDELKNRLNESKKRTMKLEAPRPLKREKDLDSIEDYQIELVRPKETAYNLIANRWLKMEWTEVPLKGVRYTLEISKTPQFHRLVSHRTTQISLSVQLDLPMTYYWRVKGQRKDQMIVSKVGKFEMTRTGGLGNVRDSRIITSELKGQVGDVASDENFDNIISSHVVTDRRCLQKGLKSGTYYCRIRSISEPKVLGTYEFEVP